MTLRVTRQYGEVLTQGGGALRVTRQYAEVLGSGGGALRVSRLYVEVLHLSVQIFTEDVNDTLTLNDLAESDPFIREQSVNETLTITDTAGLIFTVNTDDTLTINDAALSDEVYNLITSLDLGDSVLEIIFYGETTPASDILTISDDVYVETGNWRYVPETLTITDSVTAIWPYREVVGTVLNFVDHTPTTFKEIVNESLTFTDGVGTAYPQDLESVLNFDEYLSRLHYGAYTTFQVEDSVLVAKFAGAVVTTLDFDETVGLDGIFVRSVTTDSGLGHSLTYYIETPCSDKQYAIFIGETTVAAPTPPSASLPLSQGLPDNVRFMLSYPVTGGNSDTVTLRAPNFGNIDRASMDRVNRETRGGNLVIFADPDWPKIQHVSVTFSGLTQAEVIDLQQFIADYLGEEVRITDWEGREWSAVITTPNDPATNDGQDNWNVGFEFEGVLLDGYQPGESTAIQDQVAYILNLLRSESESTVFQDQVTYILTLPCSGSDSLSIEESVTYILVPA